jgi:hypothetical protein
VLEGLSRTGEVSCSSELLMSAISAWVNGWLATTSSMVKPSVVGKAANTGPTSGSWSSATAAWRPTPKRNRRFFCPVCPPATTRRRLARGMASSAGMPSARPGATAPTTARRLRAAPPVRFAWPTRVSSSSRGSEPSKAISASPVAPVGKATLAEYSARQTSGLSSLGRRFTARLRESGWAEVSPSSPTCTAKVTPIS